MLWPAPSTEQIEELNSLKADNATPHTKWAKPYAPGTVRALFLVHQSADINGLPLRHVIELMQRFDIAGDAALVMTAQGTTYAIAYAGGSGVYGGELGEQRLARLLENEYDCYVVTGPVMGHIPDKSREIIMDRVRQGAGLALLYGVVDEDQPLLADAGELEKPPTELAGLGARIFQLGKGQIVSFAPNVTWDVYHPTPEQQIFGFGLPRDLFYEGQGRAILWAAGREPKLRLSIALPAQKLDRAEMSKQAVTLNWKGTGLTGTLSIRTRVRSQSRGSRDLPPVRGLNASSGTARVKMPSLPAGDYQVEAIAESGRGIEGWAVAQFTVATPQRIRAVKLDRNWGEVGDAIEGTVEVEVPEGSEATLRVQAIDRYGRALARQEFPPPAHQVVFSLPTDARIPGYLGLEAALVTGGEEICYGYAEGAYTIPHRKQDEWNFILWGRLYASPFLELADDRLAKSGVTSRLETLPGTWWYMTRAGMNYTPYCSSGLWRPPDMGPQEPSVDNDGILAHADGCWNDEPAVSERLEKYIDAQTAYRQHGVLAYNMGDEQAPFGACLHPSCWKVYQGWLEREYGRIEALDESWGTSFKTFREVEPIMDDTALPWYSAEARRGWILHYANNEHSSAGPTPGSTAWTKAWRSYPRYIDRRSFQCWNFANYARRFGEAARRMDPYAKIGMEGTEFGLDSDIDVVVRNTDWWMPYGGGHSGETTEVIRSIARKGYLYGNFTDWTSFWDSFLRGAGTVGRWRVDNFLTPGMSLFSGDRRMVESARIVFDGLGTLLNGNPGAERLHDGIVMLHSMTSVTMSKIAAGPTYGHWRDRDDNGVARAPEESAKRSHLAWHRAIRGSGLQFEYATDGQIKRSEFDPAECKAIVLSQYEAIGREEEKLIREFVANGGTLIADVRPGIYGARGKERAGGVLDDLFGARHTGNVSAEMREGSISGQVGQAAVRVTLRDLYVNPAVELTTGRALGSAGPTPIAIVNKAGAGQAILLNFTMWSYPNLPVHDTPERARVFFRALLAAAGVKRPLELLDKDRRYHSNIEAMRWRIGDGLQVVALHGPLAAQDGVETPAPFDGLDKGVPVTVKLPGSKYVYEMRTGRNSGKPAFQFTTHVRPWYATLLVLSDRQLETPTLSASKQTVSQGEPVALRAAIPHAQGRHALKVRVTAPDGTPAPWFDQSVIVGQKGTRITLPVGYNEQEGEWTVEATDLYTGRKAAAGFRVAGRK